MNRQITQELIIPSHEIKWRFSRSSVTDGQNVNKIESQVEIKRLRQVIKDIFLSKRKVTTPNKLSKKRRVESKKKRGKLKLNRQNKLEQDLQIIPIHK